MLMMLGKGVSKGVVKGPLYFFKRQDNTITKYAVEDISAEKDRLAQAQEKAIRQLEVLAEKAREDAAVEAAILFETHAMLIEDENYVDCIQSCLDKEQCNAEYAVLTAGEQFAAMFAAMDDTCMQALASDIRDISHRLLNNLMGVAEGGIDSDVPVILAADDLAPSETIQLDKSKILGFVTRGGSSNSHTAILARAMGIPSICGLGSCLKNELNNRLAYIDGETGCLFLGPNEMT